MVAGGGVPAAMAGPRLEVPNAAVVVGRKGVPAARTKPPRLLHCMEAVAAAAAVSADVPLLVSPIAVVVVMALMSTVAATAVVERGWTAAEEGGGGTVRAVRAAAVAEKLVTQTGAVAATVMTAVVAASGVAVSAGVRAVFVVAGGGVPAAMAVPRLEVPNVTVVVRGKAVPAARTKPARLLLFMAELAAGAAPTALVAALTVVEVPEVENGLEAADMERGGTVLANATCSPLNMAGATAGLRSSAAS